MFWIQEAKANQVARSEGAMERAGVLGWNNWD